MEVASVTPRLVDTLLKVLLVTLLAAFLAPGTTWAATISTGIDDYGNHYLTLEGPIVQGDPERLAAAIFEANARGYRLDALRLNSPGGLIWEAMAMAVMVRWVENMATVIQKDATCESACFGLFAAGYRKHVDPASNPTQIGVHSISQLVKQQGASAFFSKETGDTTIWAVRRLKAIGVPDSIVGKIATTPPDRMTYLTIEDLQQMGVEVTGHPEGSAPLKVPRGDSVLLAPATVRADIKLDSGAIIPSGTVVVTISDLKPDASASICFWPEHSSDEVNPTCNISCHLPGEGTISTAQVRETSLMLIKQGWNSTISSKSSSPTPPPGQRAQAPQAERGTKRPFRVVNADDGYLNIRKGPGTQYEVIAQDAYGRSRFGRALCPARWCLETILRSRMAGGERLGVIVLYDRLRAIGNAISGSARAGCCRNGIGRANCAGMRFTRRRNARLEAGVAWPFICR